MYLSIITRLILIILGLTTVSSRAMVPTYIFANGDKIPLIGLGTWKADKGQVKMAVKEAIKCGYRHIDCAATYGNEKEVGEGIAECLKEGLVKREDLWITSKLWNDSHDRVGQALKETLDDLQLEYLDEYLIHWPVSVKRGVGLPKRADDLVPFDLEKTWRSMEALVDDGLVRHIGVSNFSVKKLNELLALARIKPEVNQIERHPYLQRREQVRFAKDNGIHVTNYCSLGSGDRPAILRAEDEPVLLQDHTILSIAEQVGATPAGVLLKWALQEGTSVIPKSVTPRRLEQNLRADEAVPTLTDEQMEQIRSLDKQRRYVDGLFWCLEGSPYTAETLWDE